MRITVVNGTPARESAPPPYAEVEERFDWFLSEAVSGWREGGHAVTVHTLRNMHIRPCNGCFNCWWKRPGRCGIQDDTHEIWPTWIASDLVVWASPLRVGFVSALLKHAVDRFIPLVHPYVELKEGQCTHQKRYDRYPVMAGLLAPGPGDDEEDVAITRRWMERTAWHAHSTLRFCHTPATAAQELRHAPDHL